jgi:DnaJ-class molecular chaperone
MSTEYDLDDELSCPACGHSPLHSRRCSNIHCQGGSVDESDEDYMLEGSVLVICEECKGTGVERWCPKCGENLSGHEFEEWDDEDEQRHPA